MLAGRWMGRGPLMDRKEWEGWSQEVLLVGAAQEASKMKAAAAG